MSSDRICKALVISCIDFRFVSKISDFLSEMGLKDSYDLITIPGSSLNLDKVSAAISTSLKLHNPGEIHIFDHEDCGAYGDDNSEERHQENLRKAKKDLAFANLKIKTYIAKFEEIKDLN